VIRQKLADIRRFQPTPENPRSIQKALGIEESVFNGWTAARSRLFPVSGWSCRLPGKPERGQIQSDSRSSATSSRPSCSMSDIDRYLSKLSHSGSWYFMHS
jgi:hypothetical protein